MAAFKLLIDTGKQNVLQRLWCKQTFDG